MFRLKIIVYKFDLSPMKMVYWIGTRNRFTLHRKYFRHGSSKTREVYTHFAKSEISKFKNPIGDIFNNSTYRLG